MPYNGAGSFSPPSSSFPAVPDTLIESAKYNAVVSDVATGLSTAITKDGQTTVTANIPMNGFKMTNLGSATARTDSSNLGNIIDGTGVYIASVGGTQDDITLLPSPAIAAYTAGQTFRFVAASTNIGPVTVAVSGLTAKAVTKNGTVALVAGDIVAGALVTITYDGTRFIITGEVLNGLYLPISGGTLTGNLLFSDALFDIGASGATRPRDLFLSRNAAVGGAATVGSTLAVTGAATFSSTVSGTAAGALTPRGHLWGLTLSNNAGDATNDIDIAVGECVSDDTTAANRALIELTSGLTKQLDAVWAVGTNAGMLATGAAIANTTYHVFLILRPDTGVVDLAADSSATGANITANTDAAYTKKRRIGSILRESAAIVPFIQDGDEFQRQTGVANASSVNPGTSAITQTLSVPVGITVQAKLDVYLTSPTTAASNAYFSDISAADIVPSGTTGVQVISITATGNSTGAAAEIRVRTNTLPCHLGARTASNLRRPSINSSRISQPQRSRSKTINRLILKCKKKPAKRSWITMTSCGMCRHNLIT